MLFDIPVRSSRPEMMDLGEGTVQDFERNFREIETVNYWLGGIRLTKNGLLAMLKHVTEGSIADMGCGSGDILKALAADARFERFNLMGVDKDPNFLEIAHRSAGQSRIAFRQADILVQKQSEQPASIFMFNMMLHHFSKEQIVSILRYHYEYCTTGLLINDLCRNYVAKGFIWVVARLFGASRQFQNDAPLSVSKGFTRADWMAILQECGFEHYDIRWDPGFRHVIKIYKQ